MAHNFVESLSHAAVSMTKTVERFCCKTEVVFSHNGCVVILAKRIQAYESEFQMQFGHSACEGALSLLL